MANMTDYLAWRGDLPLAVSPWNEIDGLLVATLSYLDFHGGQDPRGWTLEELKRIDALTERPESSTFPDRKRAFERMAKSRRFGACRMHHAIALTDDDIDMQFSALCLDLPDGTCCVAFRGTDNTIVGWREDFNMAYQTRVPAQEAAIVYLNRAAALSSRPLRLVGHSKGGNLAVYAAACAPEAVREKIESLWIYDGPGMNQEMVRNEGYLRVKDRIHAFIPKTSIIGLLMNYYEPYTVVRSTATGISQHDPMSWEVYGPCFATLPEVDETAKVVRDTLHDWLRNSTPEQRGAFVDTLFHMVDKTKATRLSDLSEEKLKSLLVMADGRKEVDPETRRVFDRLMAQAVTLGFGNVMERVRRRRDDAEDGAFVRYAADKLKEKIGAWMSRETEEEGKPAKEETEEEQNNP